MSTPKGAGHNPHQGGAMTSSMESLFKSAAVVTLLVAAFIGANPSAARADQEDPPEPCAQTKSWCCQCNWNSNFTVVTGCEKSPATTGADACKLGTPAAGGYCSGEFTCSRRVDE